MLIHPGTQELVINEVTTGAGTTVKQGSIQSDSLLAALYVNSVSSGTLSVVLSTLSDDGKEKVLITFPTISAGTTELLLRKAGDTMQRFIVRATYTGVCSYRLDVRAIENSGESSVRILGATGFRVSQQTVPAVALELIPASLDDRQGVIIKNWSISGNMFIAETEAKANPAEGYPVAPRDNVTVDVAAGVAIWAVAESTDVDARIGES